MKRKQHSVDFKLKVAAQALSGMKTISELSSTYEVHSTQINQWKKRLKEEGPSIFNLHGKKKLKNSDKLQSALYEEIGRLKFELDWLKKKSKTYC
jgi:transposase-like protein